MGIGPGQRIGHYEVVSRLGAGGMGEVWKARDPRLDRMVAVKVLPAEARDDPELRRRLELEARAAGALQHPNLLAVHDVGVHDGAPYLVAELLEGETLREAMSRGPLPRRRIVEIAAAVADGLAAAHDKGIVHRDLKPGNVFLTRAGGVKILDFGLAKRAAPPDAQAETLDATASGAILGTVGYMAPEQVRGHALDHRPDVFAFGVMLHEMLAGRRPFGGDSPIDVGSAILRDDPPPLGDDVPPALRAIVDRCLAKAPDARFQSTHDLAFAVKMAAAAGRTSQPEPEPPRRRARPLAAVVIGGLAVAAAAATAVVLTTRRDRPVAAAARAGEQLAFRPLTFRPGYVNTARFSPDGRTVLYSWTSDDAGTRILSVDPAQPEPHMLIEDALLFDVASDGELAVGTEARFFANFGQLATLSRARPGTSAPRAILEQVVSADWSPAGDEMAIVRATTGLPTDLHVLEFPQGRVVARTEAWFSHARISPDGTRVAFIDHPKRDDDSGRVAIVDRAGNVVRDERLFGSIHGLAWAPAGDEVLVGVSHDGTTSIRALDGRGGERVVAYTIGEVVVQDAAPDGRLLMTSLERRSTIRVRWAGAEVEREVAVFDSPGLADLASDGRSLLVCEWSEATASRPVTYRWRADGDVPVRLADGLPEGLSPDATRAVVMVREFGAIAVVPVGPGVPRELPSGDVATYQFLAWLDDERIVSSGTSRNDGRTWLWLQPADGSAGPKTVGPPGLVLAGRVAPDGRTVVVESETRERGFLDATTGAVRPIPNVGPDDFVVGWTADGSAMFVRRNPGATKAVIERVDVTTGAATSWRVIEGPPRPGINRIIGFRMAADGDAHAYTSTSKQSTVWLVTPSKAAR